MPAIRNSFLHQRSPSLSTWNDIATIVGVPLGAMLSLIAIMLMIKHHRQSRRHGESSRPDVELPRMPLQHIDTLNDGCPKSRVHSYDASKISPLARASTHGDVFSVAPTGMPTGAETHDGISRGPRDLSCELRPNRLQNSARTSRTTLVDEEEYNNPTMVVTFPTAVYMIP